MKTFYLNPIALFFPRSLALLEFVHAIGLCEYEISLSKKCITAQLQAKEIEIAKIKFEAKLSQETGIE